MTTHHLDTASETAACLEAVLGMRDHPAGDPVARVRVRAIAAAFDALGAAAIRLLVTGWTDAVDAAWSQVGDSYDLCFDWDFVPAWIIDNIGWSNPHNPVPRCPELISPQRYDVRLPMVLTASVRTDDGSAAALQITERANQQISDVDHGVPAASEFTIAHVPADHRHRILPSGAIPMKIFVVCGTHFAQSPEIRRYCLSHSEKEVIAADLVNILRADIDKAMLPPVTPDRWEDGLAEAQRYRLDALGTATGDINISDLAKEAEFDVWIETAEPEGRCLPMLDYSELAAVVAALRQLQEKGCPSDLLDIATGRGRHAVLTTDEIDNLCERVKAGNRPAVVPAIVVALDGGLVSGVVADRPVMLRIVDYDVEGADDEDVSLVPQDDGRFAEAIVSRWSGSSIKFDPAWIERLDTALGTEE